MKKRPLIRYIHGYVWLHTDCLWLGLDAQQFQYYHLARLLSEPGGDHEGRFVMSVRDKATLMRCGIATVVRVEKELLGKQLLTLKDGELYIVAQAKQTPIHNGVLALDQILDFLKEHGTNNLFSGYSRRKGKQAPLVHVENAPVTITVPVGNTELPSAEGVTVSVRNTELPDCFCAEHPIADHCSTVEQTVSVRNSADTNSEAAFKEVLKKIKKEGYVKDEGAKAPSPKIPNSLKGKSNGDPRVHETELLLEKVRGFKTPRFLPERAAIKAMLVQGYAPEDIIGCWQAMKLDPWRATRELLLPSVQTEIGQWVKNGSQPNAFEKKGRTDGRQYPGTGGPQANRGYSQPGLGRAREATREELEDLAKLSGQED